MSWVEFQPVIPVFERAKAVHALDCAATVSGSSDYMTSTWYSKLEFSHLNIRYFIVWILAASLKNHLLCTPAATLDRILCESLVFNQPQIWNNCHEINAIYRIILRTTLLIGVQTSDWLQQFGHISLPACGYIILPKETTLGFYSSHTLSIFILRLYFRYKFLLNIRGVTYVGDIPRNPQNDI
jgi:hypothetical protein